MSSAATATGSAALGARLRGSLRFHQGVVFSSLLSGYTGYYLCRQNLSVAYTSMQDGFGMSPVTYGWIVSLGTLAYAIGKLTLAPMADHRGGRLVFLLGLAGSAAATTLLGVGPESVVLLAVLWTVNRLFQSMGWGGLASLVGKWFPPQGRGTVMGAVSVSYQFGGAAATLFAGVMLGLGYGWRGAFLGPALVLGLIGLTIRGLLWETPLERGFPLQDERAQAASPSPVGYVSGLRELLGKPGFVAMLGLSFVLTLLRECFNLWMPIYFAAQGESAATAAFKSAVFPILGSVGTILAGYVSDRYFSRKRGPVMIGMLAGLVVVLLGLALATHPVAKLVLVAAAGFCLLGPYSLIGGIFALDVGGARLAGTASGALDGAGYLAATLAGIGVAQVVVHSGWAVAYLAMAGLALVAVALTLRTRGA